MTKLFSRGRKPKREERKKVEKTFKKPLDKVKTAWYNNKAVRERVDGGKNRSLKIEQQRNVLKTPKILLNLKRSSKVIES